MRWVNISFEKRRLPAEPSPSPVREPVNPPENPEMPVRKPNPDDPPRYVVVYGEQYDPKTEIRSVSIVLTEKGSKDRQAAQSWNVRHAEGRTSP